MLFWETMKERYVVATIKKWNIKIFEEKIKKLKGEWYLITDPMDLNLGKIEYISPKYIFFPHWSKKVPKEIVSNYECVCFHETDLPFGRGGSPIQNLIYNGYRETVITAFKMTENLDDGPIYIKRKLCLEGLAEEIFIRAAKVIAEMIEYIITHNPTPKPQQGKVTIFKRRKPEESNILLSDKLKNLEDLFDFLRMLDAETYPKAFFEINGFKFEFSRPALRTDFIEADVKITKIKGSEDDRNKKI